MSNEYYFDKQNWEINQEGRGTQVHPFVALALAAVLGATFVFFMPFIGLALVVQHFGAKMGIALGNFFRSLLVPAAEPGMSYFTGQKTENGSAPEDSLKELSKEIEDRRDQ